MGTGLVGLFLRTGEDFLNATSDPEIAI